MFGLGPFELLIILGIFILLFGKRMPAAAHGLGQSLKAFKQGLLGDYHSGND